MRKIFLTLSIILLVVMVYFPKPALAQVAWPDFGGAAFEEMLRQIDNQIQGSIMGALKQAAAQMINDTVDSLISGGGGGGGGALYIQDWDNELFYKPMKETEVFIEGYLTSQLKGRAADYSASSQAEGIVKNYGDYVKEFAKSSLGVSEKNTKTVSYDACKDPNRPLSQDDFRCWTQTAGLPMKTALDLQRQTMAYYEQEQRKAEIQAIAYQGFLAQKQGDYVLTPGSTLKDIESSTQDLGNKILSDAKNIPEVITALVTKLVTKTIKQGIGSAQRNIQREINSNIGSIRSDINQQIQSSGVGSVLKPKF